MSFIKNAVSEILPHMPIIWMGIDSSVLSRNKLTDKNCFVFFKPLCMKLHHTIIPKAQSSPKHNHPQSTIIPKALGRSLVWERMRSVSRGGSLAAFMCLGTASQDDVRQAHRPFVARPVLESWQRVGNFVGGIQVGYQSAGIGHSHHYQYVPGK